MSQPRIKWCLADLMKEKGCRNKDLVSMTGLHAVTISKLKHAEMPERLERSTLEKLCDALECEPGDLMWLNKHPHKSVESANFNEELSQKKNLNRRQLELNEKPVEGLEFNQIYSAASPSHFPYMLERVATIDYCAGSLIEEVEELPQKMQEKISPLLAVLHRACKEQLAMLNESKQNSFQQKSKQLNESVMH